jgi:hypothetical protein
MYEEYVMQTRKRFMAVALGLVVLLTSGVFADDSCTDCHNDTTIITGKVFGWETSGHATGTAAAYAGGRGSCTACHSGASFSASVAAGQPVQDFTTVTDVTRQDCRACHQIHTSNTAGDWALETVAPVTLYASGAEYDGGKGNLCANCHQPRRAIAAADPNGNVAVTSSHWGPHHGPQSAVLMGVGGAGDVVGEASGHSWMVEDTCVSCHVGEGMNHTFAPSVSACLDCHDEVEGDGAHDFDFGGVRTQVAALLVELHDLLEAKGMYHDHPVVGVYPAAEAQALWNYILIAVEDGSLGAHNASYTVDLLEASVAALK